MHHIHSEVPPAHFTFFFFLPYCRLTPSSWGTCALPRSTTRRAWRRRRRQLRRPLSRNKLPCGHLCLSAFYVSTIIIKLCFVDKPISDSFPFILTPSVWWLHETNRLIGCLGLKCDVGCHGFIIKITKGNEYLNLMFHRATSSWVKQLKMDFKPSH